MYSVYQQLFGDYSVQKLFGYSERVKYDVALSTDYFTDTWIRV